MLGELAAKEMQRDLVMAELEENTLRTIEVINISDIRIERDNLELHLNELWKKQAELDRVEEELELEKEKIEEKKRKRMGGKKQTQ